jgi:two-component system, NarL family, sensor histidine kinase UhpB
MIEIHPPTRILILENSPYDYNLIKEILKSEIRDVECFCVTGKIGYLKALDQFQPDIILAENFYPDFFAKEALEILRTKKGDTPFILVTANQSEDIAVDMLSCGANDYIMKDRMERLPFAVAAALKQRRASKEISEYRYALDKAAIVAITDEQGIITYANKNCCKLSGYKATELIGSNYNVLLTGLQHPNLLDETFSTVKKGSMWQGEFLNQAKDGNGYWLHTIIIPFLNERNEPRQYLAISNDITDRKKLELALMEQAYNEQLKMVALSLEAQEKERNIIGQELHDNVNQLLVATRLLLSLVINGQGEAETLLKLCNDHVYNAIEENRKIARTLVTPNFESESLAEQLKNLWQSMLGITGLTTDIDTSNFDEELLSKPQKLAIYRISQEQCTNIVKYAAANHVTIKMETSEANFKMTIADDGQGSIVEKTKGVGLKNIAGRLKVFNGRLSTISSPGEGFLLSFEIPLTASA